MPYRTQMIKYHVLKAHTSTTYIHNMQTIYYQVTTSLVYFQTDVLSYRESTCTADLVRSEQEDE